LELRRSRSTPLSSRAILAIGGLGMAWLMLAGFVVLQMEADGQSHSDRHVVAVDELPPRAPLPMAVARADRPEQAASSDLSAALESASDSPAEAGGGDALPDLFVANEHGDDLPPGGSLATDVREDAAVVATIEPLRSPVIDEQRHASPVPPPSLPLHPSLRNAGDEPILIELVALFETVHIGLERPDASFDPVLDPYVATLAGRMNSYGHPFVLYLSDKNLDIARRRAARAHALLVDAGLRPWLLDVHGRSGDVGVVVERP
jgi:hypothetical protein